MVAQLKKSKTTLLVLGALVAGLTIGGMSIANAAGRAPQTVTRAYASAPMMGTTSPIATLSNLTGLTVQEIQTLRAQGKTLATIATENGVNPTAVVDQTVAARQSYFDGLVATGRMTAAQEQTVLDRIRAGVQAMMDATPGTRAIPAPAPSVPATVGAGMGFRGPNPRWSANTQAPVGPRYGSTTTGRVPCRTYVAPTAPAPAGAQGTTVGQPVGTTNSGGAWTGMMGPRTSGGTRGSGSCGW